MIEYLPKWHKIDELVQLVQFVGVERPEYSHDTDLSHYLCGCSSNGGFIKYHP